MSLFNTIITPSTFKMCYRSKDFGITIRHIIEAAFYCFGESEVTDEGLIIEVLHSYHLRKWGLG